MKYVLLQHPTLMPVIAAGLMVSHDEIAVPFIARGYRAVSAGFLRVTPEGRFETFGRSTSLNLDSHPDDSRVVAAMHRATLATATTGSIQYPVSSSE